MPRGGARPNSGPKPGFGRGPSSNAQIEERRELVLQYLSVLTPEYEIIKQVGTKYKIGASTIKRDIAIMFRVLQTTNLASEDRPRRKAQVRASYHMLLAMSLKKNDINNARGVLNDLRALDGLDEPEKLEVAGGLSLSATPSGDRRNTLKELLGELMDGAGVPSVIQAAAKKPYNDPIQAVATPPASGNGSNGNGHHR